MISLPRVGLSYVLSRDSRASIGTDIVTICVGGLHNRESVHCLMHCPFLSSPDGEVSFVPSQGQDLRTSSGKASPQ